VRALVNRSYKRREESSPAERVRLEGSPFMSRRKFTLIRVLQKLILGGAKQGGKVYNRRLSGFQSGNPRALRKLLLKSAKIATALVAVPLEREQPRGLPLRRPL
jgi:hypothetical protein